METIIAAMIFSTIPFVILYFVIKSAVRNAIIEARYINKSENNSDEEDGTGIKKITCPNCKNKHDMDYPKCPYCKHE